MYSTDTRREFQQYCEEACDQQSMFLILTYGLNILTCPDGDFHRVKV